MNYHIDISMSSVASSNGRKKTKTNNNNNQKEDRMTHANFCLHKMPKWCICDGRMQRVNATEFGDVTSIGCRRARVIK